MTHPTPSLCLRLAGVLAAASLPALAVDPFYVLATSKVGISADAVTDQGYPGQHGRMTGGVCVADFNADTYPDIFVPGLGTSPDKLYINNQNGTFTDRAAEWGVDKDYTHRGGLKEAKPEEAPRQVWLLQRKTSKVGAGLGKTTGWIHRAGLNAKGVHMMPSVTYRKIDDEGFHISIENEDQVLPVDTVIVCAGQDPLRELEAPLKAAGKTVHLIGGADVAAELDAKRAIHQGTTLAATV